MSLYQGYEPASSCTGGPTEGARALMAWFLASYGARGGRNGGIYNCATIPGSMALSIHAEGRACDLMTYGASWGQPLADQIVAHSGELGIQCVIHRRRIWSGSYPYAGWRTYYGANPHEDHLHVELSRQAARTLSVPRIVAVFSPAPVPAPAPVVPSKVSVPLRVDLYDWTHKVALGYGIQYSLNIMRALNPGIDSYILWLDHGPGRPKTPIFHRGTPPVRIR